MKPLLGKRALVTGASRGIGRAIALRLAQDGAIVAVHYGHDGAAAAAVVAEIEAAGGRGFSVACALDTIEYIPDLFAQLQAEFEARTGASTLDILVNNAGVCHIEHISSVSEARFDAQFNLNIKALFFVTRHALQDFNSGGRIVNLSSVASRQAKPHVIAYAASKGAVDSFTLVLAAELGPRNITVNAVAPGMTATEMVAERLQHDASSRDQAIGAIALGRLGEPADVADVVAFLASDAGRWITGQVLNASGGTNL